MPSLTHLIRRLTTCKTEFELSIGEDWHLPRLMVPGFKMQHFLIYLPPYLWLSTTQSLVFLPGWVPVLFNLFPLLACLLPSWLPFSLTLKGSPPDFVIKGTFLPITPFCSVSCWFVSDLMITCLFSVCVAFVLYCSQFTSMSSRFARVVFSKQCRSFRWLLNDL